MEQAQGDTISLDRVCNTGLAGTGRGLCKAGAFTCLYHISPICLCRSLPPLSSLFPLFVYFNSFETFAQSANVM